MNKKELNHIQKQIDYEFKNPDLLQQAFIRRSYSEEHGGENNEVLEFIGDKALDLIVVKYLSDRYGYYSHDYEDVSLAKLPNYYMNECDEGELTEMKSRLVQKKKLAERIDCFGFADHLVMNKSDKDDKAYNSASVKEDLFEAIIGAVALDSNWDLDSIGRVVEVMLQPEDELGDDEDNGSNYVGALQEWALSKEGELPKYHIEPYNTVWMYMGGYRRGNHRPLNAAQPKYQCKIKLPGINEVFLDFGASQKEARMLAAKTALEYIESHGLEFSIKDEIKDPNYNDSIGQLETLARRGYFSIPEYIFDSRNDEDGNPIWTCECSIEEEDEIMQGESSSKKDAKKQAAFKMLRYVLDCR